jgi:hypothetical protein
VQTEIELWQQADDVQTCQISSPSGRVQIDASSFDTFNVFYDAILSHPKLYCQRDFYVSSGAVFCYKSNGVDRTPHFMSCKYAMEGDPHY